MDVRIADSFTKSLKEMMWHESKVYKFYALFRYKLPHFFKNIWLFRKVLWRHRWWDYSFTLEALQTSLQIQSENLEKYGIEVDKSRLKKVDKMNRVIEILSHIRTDNYFERAEEAVGKPELRDWKFEEEEGSDWIKLVDDETPEEKESWKRYFDYAQKLEEKEWKELWDILKGKRGKQDGSGMRGWWD